MPDTGFRARLARLFSTQVVVRRTGKNSVRVVDTAKLQSQGKRDRNRYIYSGLHTHRLGGSYYTSNYSANFSTAKLELYRDYECLSGDTEIPMVDGSTKTLLELSALSDKFYVYSYDHENDRIQLGEAHSVRKTKTAQTYKILFDDGSFLIATENHPFLMRDGNYKRVDEINVGDSVMPSELTLNHTIVSIEKHDVRDVYDMTVEKYHNFATTICFVHNSMDMDPILASALDIYADESTKKSPENRILDITSPNENIKDILNNLFYDTLNIEFNLWPWIRNVCKYGDFFLLLDLEEELGVKNVIPIGSYDMDRVEGLNPENPYEVVFRYLPYGSGILSTERREFQYYEIAHFRLLTDTNFLPNGRSMMEPARKEFKRLTLMEDAMMIHRIMRAPQRRIYNIAVGNLNPAEVDQYMQKIIDRTKKIPYVDERGNYNLKFNLQNMVEDIYIPDRGGGQSTKVDTLEGMSQPGFVEDIDYVKNKMMAALKIPKTYLGYDEGASGKSVVAAEDIRFARTIERIQSVAESELTKIAIVHLYLQGYEDSDLVNFDIKLHNPSIVYERQRVEVLKEKMDLLMSHKESRFFSREYLYKYIFNLSDSEIGEEEAKILRDLKLEFRMKQIQDEGNDPKETGEIKGTAHVVAQMHSSDDDDEDGEGKISAKDIKNRDKEETRGRDKSLSTFSTSRDKVHGRDPLGYKDVKRELRPTTEMIIRALHKRFKNKGLREMLD